MNKKVKTSTVKDSKKHLHLVHSNPAELPKSKKFKVYSSSPLQRLANRLRFFNKIALNLSIIGFIGAAISYFCLLSLQFEISQHLRQLETQMKNREDLKSSLGKIYSWSNIDTEAQKANLKKASQIEIVKTKASLSHNIYDLIR